MKCPCCQAEMVPGELCSSGKIMWLPRDRTAPWLATRWSAQRAGGVLLSYRMGALYGRTENTYRCQKCGRIIIEP